MLALLVTSRVWFAFSFPIVQVSDYSAYYDEARGLAGLGGTPPSPANAMGPKFFFAALFKIFGDDLLWIGLANTALYTLAMVALYALCCLSFDRATGVLAVLACLVSLSELYFINLASTEVPGTLFSAVIVLLLASGWRWRTLALGIASGLSIYNRSNMLPIGALVFAQELLAGARLAAAARSAAWVQLVALAVTLPLCFFDYHHFGRFTPLTANSQQIWYGNNPYLSGDTHHHSSTPESFSLTSKDRARLRREFAPFYLNPDSKMEFSKLNPYDVSNVQVRYALGWIRHHPGRYLQLIVARFQLFFFSCTYGEAPYWTSYARDNPAQPRWTPAHERLIANARLPVRRLYQVLIAGAGLGLLLTVAHYGPRAFLRSPKAAPLLFIAFYTTPFLLTIGANRYHVPILCLCWVYLAHGLVLLGRRLLPAH